MGSGLLFVFSILVPQIQRKYQVQQAEPPCLVSLITSGRLPGIPEWAILSRLTHCHSSYRHGAHTVGLAGGLCSALGCCGPACLSTTAAYTSPLSVSQSCWLLSSASSHVEPWLWAHYRTHAQTQGGSWQAQTGCLSWKTHQLSLSSRGTAENPSRTEPHFWLRSDTQGPKCT